jgi:hypothetical protein
VLADALKLVWVERECFPNGAQKFLLFGDSVAAGHFSRVTWASKALAALRVKVRVFEFDTDRRERLVEAQQRQGAKFIGRQRPPLGVKGAGTPDAESGRET